ncbi:cmp deaminase [Diplodia corticola]|uniref:Cmp deaminase n=1 Tax=Diplodia corticola TaxID=236234 RepID=A0A1J9S6E0_9PEZI|nr:cmp deaminase [Diplodia corticola]OJD35181.1 cmp deaminase [Diplodia corticola]
MSSTVFPPRAPLPSPDQQAAGIEACLRVQRLATAQGKRPFAGALIGPDNETLLLTHCSLSHVDHAESSLARLAALHYPQDFLWKCTLYSTWEPCAMCTGTIYWANIGRIVYAATNDQLAELTGKGNRENYTMKWHCRDILEGSQKDIQVLGPLEGLDKTVVEESDAYWKPLREKSHATQDNL